MPSIPNHPFIQRPALLEKVHWAYICDAFSDFMAQYSCQHAVHAGWWGEAETTLGVGECCSPTVAAAPLLTCFCLPDLQTS